jgi:hypothetical protein
MWKEAVVAYLKILVKQYHSTPVEAQGGEDV